MTDNIINYPDLFVGVLAMLIVKYLTVDNLLLQLFGENNTLYGMGTHAHACGHQENKSVSQGIHPIYAFVTLCHFLDSELCLYPMLEDFSTSASLRLYNQANLSWK